MLFDELSLGTRPTRHQVSSSRFQFEDVHLPDKALAGYFRRGRTALRLTYHAVATFGWQGPGTAGERYTGWDDWHYSQRLADERHRRVALAFEVFGCVRGLLCFNEGCPFAKFD